MAIALTNARAMGWGRSPGVSAEPATGDLQLAVDQPRAVLRRVPAGSRLPFSERAVD